jgi:membrane-associated phospholipid phosphatase
MDTPYILLLKKYNLKYPQNYINLFYDIVKPVLLNIKGYWNRARPKQLAEFYNIDIDVILTDTHHTAAYPSGHTVYSSLVSNILKDIYPQINKKELDHIVNETAKARVLQGVHYPTDNEASIIFTNFLFNKLDKKLRKYL